MSNETDLDWLARNVHVWREGANYVCVNHTDGGYVFHEHNRNCAIWFTKDQWLARRAELASQFKPLTSIEDNQEQVMTQQKDMKQDNGWFERGDLPPVGTVCEVLWNEGRMEYLRTKVFGVNEHGQPIHRFDEGPNKFEYQADPLVTILGTRVFRPIRTERDVLIEIIKKTDDTDDRIADAILAAGFSLRGK